MRVMSPHTNESCLLTFFLCAAAVEQPVNRREEQAQAAVRFIRPFIYLYVCIRNEDCPSDVCVCVCVRLSVCACVCE